VDSTTITLQQSFLETNFHEIQFAAIFGGMILLFLIEGFIPRRQTDKNQTSRWLSNIGLALFNHFFIIFYSVLVFGLLVQFKPESPLIEHFKMSDISSLLIVILIMELMTYWIHRLFHKVEFLWRIHAVHHSDTEIDVTTSHRHHPFEPMINALIITPIIFALGAPFIVLAIYTFMHTAISLFSHSNIVLPQKLDSILRLFIVTPDFHRMHHSSDKQYTNSNYGAMQPWLDHLFRTASKKPYENLPDMEVGLEVLRKNKDNRLDKLFTTPFIYKTESK
jgi:sterol desaturase/sphingolipid hydroxylase (fatty acid hydroxylase superfamily)